MGLGSVMGNIGVALAGAPRRAKTPTFIAPGSIGPTPVPPTVPPVDYSDQEEDDTASPADYANTPASQVGGNIKPGYQMQEDALQQRLAHPPMAPNTVQLDENGRPVLDEKGKPKLMEGSQKIGLARKIGGGILMNMGGVLGQTLGTKLAYGGYPEQLQRYQSDVANLTLAQEAANKAQDRAVKEANERRLEEKSRNDTAESIARRKDLALTRGANERKSAADLMSTGAAKPYIAPPPQTHDMAAPNVPVPMEGTQVTVPSPPKPSNVVSLGGMDLEVGKKPTEFKTIEERLLAVMEDGSLTPEQSKQKQDALIQAHNLLHPRAPIHGIETDASGNGTLVVADPAHPESVQKIPLGKIGKPQQPPGAGQAYSPQEIRRNDEQLAQGIVDGDPVSLKNLSMRTGGRSMVLGRAMDLAKEQGKKFDPTYPDRVIKQLDYYSNGKGADAIQSFDTFLAHASNALDAAQKVSQTNVKLLNKPLSWWRTEMSNDPAFAQLDISLEPVAKEFESFLLNGRALYSDDRVKIEKLLNVNQPLGVKIAALKQLAMTAKDRFGSMNQRYKNLTKEDLPAVWSPAAMDAARKLGISLAPDGHGGGTKLQTVTTKEQFDALPVGAQYLDKNGNTREK